MLSLLPHGKVSKQIEYKASEYGIKVTLIDESYTSGVDSLLNQTVSKENYTPEARKYRGLFKSILGLINADVNGARNILKKFKKKWNDYITGLKQTIRIRVFGKLKSSPKFVRVYGQIGVERCEVCFKAYFGIFDLKHTSGDRLSGIRLHQSSKLPEKPPTNLQFEPAVRQSTLVGV